MFDFYMGIYAHLKLLIFFLLKIQGTNTISLIVSSYKLNLNQALK